MRRAIMVDVDGVLIVHPHAQGWSANLEHDLGVSAAALQEVFFKPHWDDVVRGRAILRERLAPALAALAPTVSCDELIAYWFSNDNHIDSRLLRELRTIRSAGVEVHLATVQEHERAKYLWESMGFCRDFDGMHYAAALGLSKPAAGFYRAIEAQTSLSPDAIFFIDDKLANVEGARECGWTAAHWTGERTLRDLIAESDWIAR
jgi:putative hydrolase of the HAD superfamily